MIEGLASDDLDFAAGDRQRRVAGDSAEAGNAARDSTGKAVNDDVAPTELKGRANLVLKRRAVCHLVVGVVAGVRELTGGIAAQIALEVNEAHMRNRRASRSRTTEVLGTGSQFPRATGAKDCNSGAVNADTKTVTNGIVPDSNGIIFNIAGTFASP